MLLTTHLALGYFFSKRTRRIVYLLAPIAIIAIFLALYAFLVIFSVMTGFSQHVRQTLIGFEAHITLFEKDEPLSPSQIKLITDLDGVRALVPIIEFDALFVTNQRETVAVRVRGQDINPLSDNAGVPIFWFEPDEDEETNLFPELLMGEELYARLPFAPLEPELGTIIQPFGDIGPTGELEPLQRQFQVRGLIKTTFYDYDNLYVLMDRVQARSLAPRESLRYLIYLKSEGMTESVGESLKQKFPSHKITSWQQQNQGLQRAFQLEKIGITTLIIIVLLIACFNIYYFTSLLSEFHLREMAFLNAIGLASTQIRAVFLKLGVLVSMFGVVPALILAWFTLYWLQRYPLPLPPAYYVEYLPVVIDPLIFASVALGVPLIAFLCSYYPARMMSKQSPINVLRET